MYANGESERITGAAIRAERSRWILATKAGNPMRGPGDAPPATGGSSRRWLTMACDASLARLGTDWIDVYYLHKDDPVTPVAETVAAPIGDLIARRGKIRYFGVSNFRGWRIAEVMRWCEKLAVPPPVVCQPYYNLLNRAPEVEVLPACEHYGIGVASYSPIARGVLTGKYGGRRARGLARGAQGQAHHGDGVPRGVVRDRRDAEGACRGERPLADPVRARVAVGEPQRDVGDRGPRTLEQWRAYVDALGTPWSADDEALVDGLVAPGHPSTPGYNDPAYPLTGRRLA